MFQLLLSDASAALSNDTKLGGSKETHCIMLGIYEWNMKFSLKHKWRHRSRCGKNGQNYVNEQIWHVVSTSPTN